MSDEPIFYDKLKKVFDSSLIKTKRDYLFNNAKVPILISAICGIVLIFSSYKASAAFHALLNRNATQPSVYSLSEKQNGQPEIFVDISGSVVRPQTYKITRGTRLFQLLELAGGLSAEADRAFIQRNYNLSVILTDQQKIHFPSVSELRDGYFTEHRRLVTLELLDDVPQKTSAQSLKTPFDANASKISINNATQSELESLPGIGPVTAQRIIAGRPFSRLDDLTAQEIIKESLYEQIVQQLDL